MVAVVVIVGACRVQGTINSRAYSDADGVLDLLSCATANGAIIGLYPYDNGQGTCGGRNQQWTWFSNGKRAACCLQHASTRAIATALFIGCCAQARW